MFLFSSSVFAQYPANPVHTPGLFERIMNTPITKETLTTGAQRAGAVVVAHKGKMALGTLAVGGVLWYNYLIAHPEKMSEFFATHPDLLEKFTQYVDYRIEHAQSQDEYDTFANVKQQLALDQNSNEFQSVAITNDPVYQQLEKTVQDEVDNTILVVEQSGQMPKCSIAVVAQLLENKDIFENGANLVLPNIQHIPTDMLDVNTFKLLKNKYKTKLAPIKITPDHIPSFGALAYFFGKYGFKIPERENSALEANSSSITIPTDLHIKGSRTFGGRNIKKDINNETRIQQDAQNLLKATVLDIATTAYLFEINPQYNVSSTDYIQNAMTLVARNKILCMYDVKYKK